MPKTVTKSGRPGKWSTSKTEPIRVPSYLAQHLLAIARQLDEQPQQPARRYLVTWGDRRYLLEEPDNLTPQQELLIEQAVDRFWRLTSGLSYDEHLWIIGELASQYGRRIDA